MGQTAKIWSHWFIKEEVAQRQQFFEQSQTDHMKENQKEDNEMKEKKEKITEDSEKGYILLKEIVMCKVRRHSSC